VVQALGGTRTIVLGALGASVGFVLATLAPVWPLALAGYALVGVGGANIVPVLFSAAGRQTLMPESAAVPAITAMGYAGILAGPALIGFAAHVSSLSAAFLALAALLLGVAASGRILHAHEVI
jgi:MFS family permease